jgi:predicted MFS family arabinose efflux permease
VLLAVADFYSGARTFNSSTHGLTFPAHVRPAAMGSRAATMQLGYLGGSTLGGLALALGGYTGLGVVLAALGLAAAAVLVLPLRTAARRTRTRLPASDRLGSCTA